MGLDVASIKYLQLVRNKFNVNFENVAVLGRQKLVLSDEDLLCVCNFAGYHRSIDNIRQSDGFSESLFKKLFQSKKIDSFDYSDYEHATNIVDLNNPIPDKYEEQYSLVIDGGTMEHVFNYPVALQNAMRMCSRGGYIVLMTPTNNYNGHGFYQFSADLFFAVLNGNGFSIQNISYVEEYGNDIYVSYKLEMPIHNRKLRTGRRVCLQVCAKKIGKIPPKLTAQQSSYQRYWEKSVNKVVGNGYLHFYDLDREIENSLGNDNGNKYNKITGKKLLLYGAGKVCHSIIEENLFESNGVKIVGIADKNANNIRVDGFLVEEPEYFKSFDFDYIVITTGENIASEIKEELIEIYGYSSEKILDLGIFLYYLRSCLF